MIVTLSIPGEPAVKERPRCGKRVKSTARQVSAENTLANLFKQKYIVPEPYDGPVSVIVGFWTRSASKDIDNMLKLVLDALNGVLWRDDRQVYAVKATVSRCDDPGTLLTISVEDGAVLSREDQVKA